MGDDNMDKLKIVKRLAELYKNGVNIIAYLKKMDSSKLNSIEDIMISYDFQAGSYVQAYENDKEFSKKYSSAIAKVINGLECSKESIFECGVGEATTLVNVVKKLVDKYQFVGGNDISWSRIAVGKNFARKQGVEVELVVGNMFNLPLADNSIDIVYTSHSLEPNGGHEKELLKELYRVSKEYIILLEPAYELADDSAKERMEQHGYVKGLYQKAMDLGYDVEEYRLFDVSSNPLNPTGLMVIKKGARSSLHKSQFCCPITKVPLKEIGNVYYAPDALLAYPIMNGVPCLVKEQAVVATKLSDVMG